MVFLYHSPFNYGYKPLGFIANSYLFVDFFFILSGFVISYAYGEKLGRNLSFWPYIVLRLGRIYPLHLFMLFVWVPYILIKQYLYTSGFGGNDQFEYSNLYSFLTNLTLLHSMGLHSSLNWNYPSWSISVEFFTYVTFYFFIVSLDKNKKLLIPLCITLMCYTFLLGLDRPNLDIVSDFGFFRCLGGFYLGVFVFRLKRLSLLPKKIPAINAVEGVIILFLITTITYSDISKLLLALAILSFSIAIVVFANEENGYLGKLLENSLIRMLGIWSYSIYMLHGIILAGTSNIFEYILKINLNLGLGFAAIAYNLLVLLIIVLLSKYTYEYVEKRFRDGIKNKVKEMNKG